MIAVFWISVGFLGQALFGLRFFIQWLASERARRSVMPSIFWHISIPAGALLLAYALWRQDPVFILNESLCLFIFIRNSMMATNQDALVINSSL